VFHCTLKREIQATAICRKGDIDKFVGDEIMALFDGPEKGLAWWDGVFALAVK
jgi:class 3 adenylate cyclase